MNRILATAALALALCAPVAAHAGMDEITAANFTEKYVATVAIMTRAGAKPETVCYTPEQGGGCMTIMEMTDVPQGVFYSAHQWKTSGASYTFMCLAPIGGENRECVNQFGQHTLERLDSAAGMWRTVGTFKR